MSRSGFAESWSARLLHTVPPLLLTLGLMAWAAGWAVVPTLERIEGWWHDTRMALALRWTPAPAQLPVAIVGIDEASLSQVGRWPWERSRLAELIERIHALGARTVALDVILSDASRDDTLSTLQDWAAGALKDDPAFLRQLQAERPRLDRDGGLVQALGRVPTVLGVYFTTQPRVTGALPSPIVPPVPHRALAPWVGSGGNLARLQAAAADGGFLNTLPDDDGVRRRAPLLIAHEGQLYGSLGLVMAHQWIGAPPIQVRTEDARAGAVAIRLGDLAPIRTGARTEILLPFGAIGALPPVHSAAAVLRGTVDADALRGKAVFIGATAPGLSDLHTTPLGRSVAGVVAHASLMQAILTGRVPYQPTWTPAAQVLSMAAIALLFAALPGRHVLATPLLAALLIAGLGIVSLVAWATRAWALPVATLALQVGSVSAWHVLAARLTEGRARKRLTTLFGQYVPPELVDRMSRDPGSYDMQGRSAELTVLFADIRGFTALAEALPPTQVSALVNECFSELTDAIRHHRGTLDKYIGDAVMAFWGAPFEDEQHALHAVEAALQMQAAMPALNARFAERGWPSLALSIGINTGPMVVGDLGSRHRRAYTVMGDAVNVAARLQQSAEALGVDIVIGQSTRNAIGGWPCRALETVTLRGRVAPVQPYEPLPLHSLVEPSTSANGR